MLTYDKGNQLYKNNELNINFTLLLCVHLEFR